MAGRRVVPRAGAHALQRHHHPAGQPDRSGSPGGRRLHERLHLLRPHRVSYRRAKHRREGRPRHPLRPHAERLPAAGRVGEGDAGHPARNGHERGRSGPPRQPPAVRDRLHSQPVSLHRHWLPGHLQRAEARGHSGLLPRKVCPQQRLLRRGGRCEAGGGRGPNPRRLHKIQGPPAAVRRVARGTEADGSARHNRGGTHRVGLLLPGLAHSRRAASGRARPRRAGRTAGRRPQLAALPGSARNQGPGELSGCLDL